MRLARSLKTETEYEIRDGEEVPRCLVHEKPLDRVEEESYFFRLSDYDEILLEKIENTDLVRPESRRNEIVSFIKGGLQDLSISRDKKNVSWGVPVPDDENHVMYVWVDALSNYLTAIGFENETQANIGWEKYWQNAHHFVGKDILRFHNCLLVFILACGGNRASAERLCPRNVARWRWQKDGEDIGECYKT